jgi:hypothetical protein
MSARSALRTSCVVLLACFLFCASASGKGEGVNGGLNAAKAFDKYTVYWAGSEVDGLPLEDISYSSKGFTFFYGSCELAGTDHPSCAPPVEVQLWSTCERGAQAVWHPGLPVVGHGVVEQGPLEIFTGRTTVVVFVEEGDLKQRSEARKLGFAVGRELRTIDQTQPSRLPPPAKDSLSGKLPCQAKPG